MNFYPNPDGPALLSVLLEGFQDNELEAGFKPLSRQLAKGCQNDRIC
jgi:hypothetical protein